MQKGFITPAVALIVATLFVGVPLAAWYTATPEPQVAEEPAVGGFGDPFLSLQVGTDPTNGDCLTTDGTNSTWSATCGSGGGSATTTINGVTGPTFSFATGTATGIGLTIASSSGTLTFTPTVSSGYVIPLSASTTEWATAYGWGDHSLAGYLTGVAWGDITGTLSNQTDLQTALNAKQDTLTTGNLTESITGLEFDATRSVIGGAAALSLTSGYVIPLSASTTEWAAAHASTTALTPAYIRGLFSGTSPVSYNSGTGAIGITADAIGDTELAFNTGQNLTTTSAPTFASSTFSNLTSAVLLTTAGGLLQEYAGTACTNQFVRSLSALAAATCAAVNLTSDVTGTLPIANGGTGETSATNAFAALAPSLAKGGLISSNGVSNPSALLVGSNGTILMASSSASLGIAWTATSSLGITASAGGSNTQLQYNNAGALAGLSTLTTDGSSLTMTGTSTLATTTITNLLGMTSIDSTSITTIENAFDTVSAALETAIEAALDTLTNLTNVAVSTVLQIPNGTGPTCNDPGEVCHDTSSSTNPQLILDDYVVARGVNKLFSFQLSSSSPQFTPGATTTLPVEIDGYTVTNIYCFVIGGTSKIIRLFGETITCTTSNTADDGSIASPTAASLSVNNNVVASTTSGVVNYLNVSIFGTYTRK